MRHLSENAAVFKKNKIYINKNGVRRLIKYKVWSIQRKGMKNQEPKRKPNQNLLVGVMRKQKKSK